MKIGIFTLPFHTNYGGILQAYALQTVLEKLGHQVIVYDLDRTPEHVSWFYNLRVNINIFIYSILHRISYSYHDVNKERYEGYNRFKNESFYIQKFVNNYIHSYYLKQHRLGIPQSKVDAVVVGSDQIWNPDCAQLIGGDVVNAFLPFLDKSVTRFSYAASFGHDIWRFGRNETSRTIKSIINFSGISVRETSAVSLCKEYLGVEVQQHIDPTLLLDREEYIQNINLDLVKKSSGDLLVYILDENEAKNEIVKYVEKKLNLKRFFTNKYNLYDKELKEGSIPPIEKWLRGFMDAKFVITDSFHACVFSIIFRKPFIAIGNQKRGMARFKSLFEQFKLEGCLVDSVEDVKKMDLNMTQDYENIHSIIEIERKRSLNYLINNLHVDK